MSVSYFHEITVTGVPSKIQIFKDTYLEHLRSSIINYFATYAVENDACDIISLDKDNHIASVEVLPRGPLYYKYGMIQPERYDNEFIKEIDVKCDLDTKYCIALHTRNRSLRDEVYFLSKCFPALTLLCRTWNDTDAYADTCSILKAGEQLAWLRTHHTPMSETDVEPVRHLVIKIYGADGELINEL